MIELTRYVLAALVAQTHLWPISAGWPGNVAVFAFYTLSGYLMTRVLQLTYGFAWRGTGAFVVNRILRLWPAYLVLLTVTVVAAQFLPLQQFYFLIRTPRTIPDIVTNLTIIGQVSFDFRQWLPLAKPLVTSWSLSIEVACYLLLALYFARSLSRLYVFLLVGIVAIIASMGWCYSSDDPAAYGQYCFQNRYGVIQAGILPFACGGIFYFKQKSLSQWIWKRTPFVLGALFVAMAAIYTGRVPATTIAPYLGIPVMLVVLSMTGNGGASGVADFFGRASYHLFIGHMPIAAILVTGLHVPADSFLLYAGTTAGALFLSGALVPLEWRLNHFRRRIAKSVSAGQESANSGHDDFVSGSATESSLAVRP